MRPFPFLWPHFYHTFWHSTLQRNLETSASSDSSGLLVPEWVFIAPCLFLDFFSPLNIWQTPTHPGRPRLSIATSIRVTLGSTLVRLNHCLLCPKADGHMFSPSTWKRHMQCGSAQHPLLPSHGCSDSSGSQGSASLVLGVGNHSP